MTWPQRLKCVFGIDINTCAAYSGAERIFDRVEDAESIEKILIDLEAKATAFEATRRPPCWASPQRGLFD